MKNLLASILFLIQCSLGTAAFASCEWVEVSRTTIKEVNTGRNCKLTDEIGRQWNVTVRLYLRNSCTNDSLERDYDLTECRRVQRQCTSCGYYSESELSSGESLVTYTYQAYEDGQQFGGGGGSGLNKDVTIATANAISNCEEHRARNVYCQAN